MTPEELTAATTKFETDKAQFEADKKVFDDAQEGGLENSNVKKSPLFIKLAEELAVRNKADADRQAADETTRAEAEQKRLKDAGLFDEAAKLHKDTVDALETKHAAEIQQRDVTTELLKTGFTNSTFLRGAVSGYDAESGTIAKYVKGLAADEGNKAFLGSGERNPPIPPGKTPVSGASNLSVEKIRALQASTDPKERKAVRDYLMAQLKTHGSLPDGL